MSALVRHIRDEANSNTVGQVKNYLREDMHFSAASFEDCIRSMIVSKQNKKKPVPFRRLLQILQTNFREGSNGWTSEYFLLKATLYVE